MLAKGYSSVPTVTWAKNFRGGQFSEILLNKNNSALAKLFRTMKVIFLRDKTKM
jgi:hypothetical protein